LFADPAVWSVEDVIDWLRYIQLEQYSDTFNENQINGIVVLDLTLEDLDYLQITVLAHRKILLRSINELKQSSVNKKQSQGSDRLLSSGLQRSNSANKISEERLLSKSVEVKKPIHWTQVEPLSQNKVKGDGGVSVNAADGSRQLDIFDEEAEKLAFMEAVAEWRTADGGNEKSKVTIVREYEGAPKESSKPSSVRKDDGLWKNPFDKPVVCAVSSAFPRCCFLIVLPVRTTRQFFKVNLTKRRNMLSL
jgi:hypothetical protein